MRSLIFSLLCAASLATAQQAAPPAKLVLPDILSVAGTTKDIGGVAWGYVVWLPTDVTWMAQHDVAVYVKPGLAVGTGTFVKQSIVAWTDDSSVLAARALRAEQLAANTQEMNDVDAILALLLGKLQERAGIITPLPAGRTARLAMLIRRTRSSETDAATVRALGLAHPVFRMAMGQGWTGSLSVAAGQDATIELREVNCVSGVEGAVVGRVTLRAGSPLVLDAPGAPVAVPTAFLSIPGANNPLAAVNLAELNLNVPRADGKNDLAMPLRWGVPDSLRRQSLLCTGFAVWRIGTAFSASATSANLVNWEPTGANQVRRLTRREPGPGGTWIYSKSPVLANKLFAPVGSGAAGPAVNDFVVDPDTFFVADDNDRYAWNDTTKLITGTPYNEGTSYSYCAAALDLLGRPGALSTSAVASACRTVPPPVPDVIDAQNVVVAGNEALRLRWKAATSVSATVTANGQVVNTTHYLIQRDRLKNTPPAADVMRNATNPDLQNNLISVAVVPQGTGDLTWTDPMIPNATDFGNTYFYTIRALHYGPCGYVASAPSPPVFATFRDRVGPPMPTGSVVTSCPRVGLFYNGETSTTVVNAPARVALRVRITRIDPGVKRAEVRFIYRQFTTGEPIATSVFVDNLIFGDGDVVWKDLLLPLTEEMEVVSGDQTATLIVQSYGNAGALSHPDQQTLIIHPERGTAPYSNRSTYVKNYYTGTGTPLPDDDAYVDLWERHVAGPPVTLQARGTLANTVCATWTSGVSSVARTFVAQYFTTSWTSVGLVKLPANSTQLCLAGASGDYRFWEISDPPGTPADNVCKHDAYQGTGSKLIPISISLTLSAGAKDYRIYRRLDNEALVLLAQDAQEFGNNGESIIFADSFMPPNGGTLRYYGQVFDEHGNPSALTLLSERVVVLPDLPIPVLEPPIASTGTGATTMMNVKASCPRPGVDRLEFFISPDPETSSLVVSPVGPSGPFNNNYIFTSPGGGSPNVSPVSLLNFQTGPVQSQSATTAIVQTASFRVKANTDYIVKVRAVNDDGKTGDWSPGQVFLWSPPLAAGQVPWPARPVPPVRTRLGIRPLLNSVSRSTIFGQPYQVPDQLPVGIRIGSLPLTASSYAVRYYDLIFPRDVGTVGGYSIKASAFFATGTIGAFGINTLIPWESYLYTLESGYPGAGVVRPLPLVLYRQQVSAFNGIVNGASGLATPAADTVQCSPLVTTLATTLSTAAGTNLRYLTDAEVGIMANDDGLNADIVLWDTTPVAENATYHYYLVRFNPEGEMDQIIDAGELFIPES